MKSYIVEEADNKYYKHLVIIKNGNSFSYINHGVICTVSYSVYNDYSGGDSPTVAWFTDHHEDPLIIGVFTKCQIKAAKKHGITFHPNKPKELLSDDEKTVKDVIE